MSSHEHNAAAGPASEHEDDGDVTMPADDDIVARIRAHAARVRSGQVADAAGMAEPADADAADVAGVGQVTVWTPEPEPTPGPVAESAPVAERNVAAPEPTGRTILPHDDTVAFTPAEPVEVARKQLEPGGSLIEGVSPPDSSISFWNDRPFRASGIDAPARRRNDGVPLWGLVALVVVFIVVASLAISLFVAVGGPR